MVSMVFEALMWDQFYYNAALFVSCTVVVSDHILSFSDEINYIWRRKMTPFSVMFLLNRYFALSMILKIFSVVTQPTNPTVKFDCVSVSIAQSYISHHSVYLLGTVVSEPQIYFPLLSTVTSLLAEATLLLRVYAVYHYSRPVLGFLLSVWILHLVLMSCSITGVGSLPSPVVTEVVVIDTVGTSKTIPKFSQIGGILYIFPAILFDTIVGIFLTLGLFQKSKTYESKMPLVRLIIRDGLLYFTVVFVTNICWILVHSLTAKYGHGSSDFFTFVPLETWSACITTTMIGRLTLNLRMYDPAAHNELTFQSVTSIFWHPHQDTSADTCAVGVGGEHTDNEVL